LPVARTRKLLLLAAQVVLVGLVLWFAGRQLDWHAVSQAWRSIAIRPGFLVASGALTLASYALLIYVWVQVVAGWGAALAYRPAARIWFVSNLGKYLPGKVWQIAAMGAMSNRVGVPGAVAVGASLFIAVVNVLAGAAVVLVGARGVLPIPRGASIALAAAAIALVFIPSLLPWIVRWIGSRTGKRFTLPPLSYARITFTFLGCVMGWVLQGIAFQLLAMATIAVPGSATPAWIALFTGSYLIGFLTPWAPGGVGTRELVLIAQAGTYGLTTAAGATVLAVISRVWLTCLELAPGLLLLVSRHPRSHAENARSN
jgi:hypothetical protein